MRAGHGAGGLGVTRCAQGHAFGVFCTGDAQLALLLFEPAGAGDARRVELDPARDREGDRWFVTVSGLAEPFEYLWEVTREQTPMRLLDPYARVLTGAERWAADGAFDAEPGAVIRPRRGWVGPATLDASESFDAVAVAQRPNRPLAEHVVYELHVRGFTRDPDSGVGAPGTFAGLREKIPYLTRLGVTAVEWMPCHEFEELGNPRRDPVDGSRLLNYWGYDPLNWFAPKLGYALADDPTNALREIRETVDAFHAAGIEVWLDVVFNHTAEHDAEGP
ncbi:MAG: alpha-amylase family glycosyl hydrolase, partial [Planctomycetota bacterium]|nr:alpha-amylase family glycosyl hydrolase [Planctomycetota bacterium]